MSASTFRQFVALVKSDLYRHDGARGWRAFLRHFLLTPGFSYMFWVRACAYTHAVGAIARPLYWLLWFCHRQSGFRYGFSIPWRTRIGPGFYIGHYGEVIINEGTIIGSDCNISQGVTIGQANRGAREGVATMGNRVYISPGVKIVGRVTIGDDVAIGANAVVTRDLAARSVAVGIPAKVISQEGSVGYIHFVSHD